MNTDRSASTPTLSFAEASAIEDEVTKVFLEYLHTMGERGEGTQEKQAAMYHPDVTGFGSGAQERITSGEDMLALIQQEHEQFPQGLTVEVDWVKVYPLDAVAAMAEGEMQIAITLPEGPPLTMPCRMSLVWVLQDEVWLIRHGHLSFPSSDQAEDETFPVDALRTRNQELERQVAERTAALEAAKNEVEVALANLKVTQAQLIQQEKMASLGQLTSGIAHEIKNPLNFVNNFAEVNEELARELIEELAEHSEKRIADVQEVLEDLAHGLKTNAAHIAKHGKRADRIVQSMMKHAAADSKERYRVEVKAFVEEYVNLAYQGKKTQVPNLNVQIKHDYDERIGTVEMAPQQMSRVLLNLLSNAFDAVREKATKSDGGYRPEVRITTNKVDGQVEIQVADNGPGIPEDIRDRIFEPFFTMKPTGTGTGLGLSLAYDIVTQGHGGTMTVESEEGRGATFIITLPNPLSSR